LDSGHSGRTSANERRTERRKEGKKERRKEGKSERRKEGKKDAFTSMSNE
jgi:hypothetical protein